MSEVYTSTKALSVYNVLSITGRDMQREEILSYLRDHFDEAIEASYVDAGLQFLCDRGFVKTDADGVIVVPCRLANRRARPLMRASEDKELDLG